MPERTYFTRKCPCCGEPMGVTDEDGRATYFKVFDSPAEVIADGVPEDEVVQVSVTVVDPKTAPPTAPTQ